MLPVWLVWPPAPSPAAPPSASWLRLLTPSWPSDSNVAAFSNVSASYASLSIQFAAGNDYWSNQQPPLNFGTGGNASASFTDTLVVNGGTGSGVIAFGFDVGGRSVPDHLFGWSITSSASPYETSCGPIPLPPILVGPAESHAYYFDYSVPFSISASLFGGGGANQNSNDSQGGSTNLGVRAIALFYGQGTVPSSLTLTSGSGTNYSFITSPVPEPGTFWLLSAASLAVLLIHKRINAGAS
jgi:hypothetical protein